MSRASLLLSGSGIFGTGEDTTRSLSHAENARHVQVRHGVRRVLERFPRPASPASHDHRHSTTSPTPRKAEAYSPGNFHAADRSFHQAPRSGFGWPSVEKTNLEVLRPQFPISLARRPPDAAQ